MRSDKLKIALESLKGSVQPNTDTVELTGQTARATNGAWWAEATLPEPISTPMTLPYSKLRSILRTLDDDEDQIQIVPGDTSCRLKASSTLWQLSLLNAPMEPLLDFPVINTIETSGYTLLEAFKSLKHLTHTNLSRPDLMWTWTNENQELIIGDGDRLGGYQLGSSCPGLPTLILSEICRLLAIWMSETVSFQIGEGHIGATMRDRTFQARLPTGPRFEIDWYNGVRNLLKEDPQVIRLSRSNLLTAINQARITAGEPRLKLIQANGGLALTSIDGYGNKCASKIEGSGSLKEPISLNIDHLSEAAEALTDEMIVLKICTSAVELSDNAQWEIISAHRKQGDTSY